MIKGIKKHVLMQLQKHLNKGGVIMTPFATIDDLTNLWRPMSADEQTRATGLLPVVSNRLRQEADNVGKDIDQMISESEVYKDVVKSVTVDIVARTLMTSNARAYDSVFRISTRIQCVRYIFDSWWRVVY